MPEVTARTHQV